MLFGELLYELCYYEKHYMKTFNNFFLQHCRNYQIGASGSAFEDPTLILLFFLLSSAVEALFTSFFFFRLVNALLETTAVERNKSGPKRP